ncbi:MAG: hypothetical protein IT555_01035 [Acetobacteraceae bacterium]|nr:hypothetical protein [Acetobacteraceae bacterium]
MRPHSAAEAAMLLAATAALVLGVRAGAAQSAAPSAADRGGPQSEPLRIITYTREHCGELSRRADELMQRRPRVTPESVELRDEGKRLCAEGQIRPGIIRLRRAIMLLRAPAP